MNITDLLVHFNMLTNQAYLEFFVSPDLLSALIKRIERDPRITYYAVNKSGDLRTNTHSEGPNAVTWGVFPGKEIVQVSCVTYRFSRYDARCILM
jgi:hypothetical protein